MLCGGIGSDVRNLQLDLGCLCVMGEEGGNAEGSGFTWLGTEQARCGEGEEKVTNAGELPQMPGLGVKKLRVSTMQLLSTTQLTGIKEEDR